MSQQQYQMPPQMQPQQQQQQINLILDQQHLFLNNKEPTDKQ